MTLMVPRIVVTLRKSGFDTVFLFSPRAYLSTVDSSLIKLGWAFLLAYDLSILWRLKHRDYEILWDIGGQSVFRELIFCWGGCS